MTLNFFELLMRFRVKTMRSFFVRNCQKQTEIQDILPDQNGMYN
jgi:hypothetical protein